MSAYELIAAPAPVILGATGLEGLEQCLRIIVTTVVYSVPLDRAFAHTGSFVDAPMPYAVARRLADLIEAIEKYEPRVKVISLSLADEEASQDDLMDGRVFPVIRYELREGVTL